MLTLLHKAHLKFHELVNPQELALYKAQTLVRAQTKICEDAVLLDEFVRLCKDLEEPFSDDVLATTWSRLLVKFLHVRDKEYLSVFLNYDRKSAQALRSTLASGRGGGQRKQAANDASLDMHQEPNPSTQPDNDGTEQDYDFDAEFALDDEGDAELHHLLSGDHALGDCACHE